MGKRIIQRRRGKGSLTYRTKDKSFSIKLMYPETSGKGVILKLINSLGYTAPFALIKSNNKTFFNVATDNIFEGKEIEIGKMRR